MASRKLRPGETVVIGKSPFSDIVPGTIGTVIKRMGRGYEVEVTTIFSDAFHKRSRQTRWCYFRAKELTRPEQPDDQQAPEAIDGGYGGS